MVVKGIDHTRLFGRKLPTTQQIWIGHLIPMIINCSLYAVDFGTSVALAWRYFEEQNYVWGSFTVLFIYLPSLVFFVHTVSKPHLWEEQPNTTKTALWFLARFLQIVAFPVWVIYRYTKQLFWSVEALLRDGEEQQNAIEIAGKPSRIHLYLFLQAFLQSAPQAFLQLYVLLKQYDNQIETDYMHVTCIISSLLILSSTVASFQLFESQKVLGRSKPWSLKNWLQQDDHNKKICKGMETNGSEAKEGDNFTKDKGQTTIFPESFWENISRVEDTKQQETEYQQYTHDCELSDSETSTPYLQPKNGPLSKQDISQQNDRHSGDSSSEDQESHISHEDRYLELSGSQETLSVHHSSNEQTVQSDYLSLRPPEEEAPPPPILVNKHQQNFIIRSLQASQTLETVPTQFRSTVSSLSSEEKLQKTGSELDDPMGMCVSALYWFLFLLSRMLAIASFSQSFPFVAFGLCALQYVLTAIILLYKNISQLEKVLARLSLSYIYLFCLIEFKIRFRRWLLSYIIYFLILNIEDVIITAIWFISIEMKGWWETYVLVLMCASMVLSMLTFVYYLCILKPKTVKMYDGM
ncbi:uncharacterized protein LOC124596202 isoform X1 [Schistocerca americana]|uniref:uncharacterized protein LOC124596202 isoform X1 n=1 Tax=Schistocerca americana TaxID=7009 RepID=UPI001F4F8A67|nr:uncharacterized protein LOC124596202 isoform X1 [Schistocerca americana]